MEPVRVHLTTPQLRKFHRSQPFQLSHDQLIGNGLGHHEVELDLHPNHHRRIQSNIRGGRGFRFSPETIRGGSLLGSLKKGVMRTGQYIRKNVPKSALQTAVHKIADRANLGDIGRYALDKGLDIGYSNTSGADLKRQAIDFGKDFLQKKMEGRGFHRPKKGSAEAKAWGERMKQLRMAKKNGGEMIEGGSTYAQRLARRTRNTFKPVGRAFRKFGETVAPIVVPIAKEAGKAFLDKAKAGAIDALTSQGLIKGGSTYAQRLARRTRNTFKPVGRAFRKFGETVAPIVAPIAKEAGRALLDKATQGAMGMLMGGMGVRNHRIPVQGGALRKGVPLPLYTKETMGRIGTHGLLDHQRGSRNGLLHGGSFLPLGS